MDVLFPLACFRVNSNVATQYFSGAQAVCNLAKIVGANRNESWLLMDLG